MWFVWQAFLWLPIHYARGRVAFIQLLYNYFFKSIFWMQGVVLLFPLEIHIAELWPTKKGATLQRNHHCHILAVFSGELHLICISSSFSFFYPLRLFAYINEPICIIKRKVKRSLVIYFVYDIAATSYRTAPPEGEVWLSELNTGTGFVVVFLLLA